MGGRAARRHHRLAERVRPGRPPGRRDAAAQPRAAQHARAGLPHARGSTTTSIQQPLWSGELDTPRVRTRAPYFTTWVRQQLIDRFGPEKAFEGGLKIKTTLDLDLQNAAADRDRHVPQLPRAARRPRSWRSTTRPARSARWSAAATTRQSPFNLATQGQRQPGSSFKPFILAEALQRGRERHDLWPSRQRDFIVPGTKGKEHFVVNNYEGTYAGTRSLGQALTFSDNSVYSRRRHPGRHQEDRAARAAHGHPHAGLAQPGDDARRPEGGRHPARHGARVRDVRHRRAPHHRHARRERGRAGRHPLGQADKDDKTVKENKTRSTRVLSPQLTAQEVAVMQTVVSQGTGKRAAYGGFAAGKTGTTENYGDAWFVGFTDKLTIAVWVGYPNGIMSMTHDFGGAPVEGGTYPAADLARLHGRRERDPTSASRPARAGSTSAARRRACRRCVHDADDGTTTDPVRRRRSRRWRRRRARRRPRPAPAPTAADARRPPSRLQQRQQQTPPSNSTAAAPPAAARPRTGDALGGAASASRAPGGHGRDTWREPAAQKRHGRSSAFVIPMRVPTRTSGRGPLGGPSRIGPSKRSVALSSRPMPSACVSLPGPEHRSPSRTQPAALAHQLDAVDRLERADQHRGADALGLAHDVEQRVDAVGAVDVGGPRRGRTA